MLLDDLLLPLHVGSWRTLTLDDHLARHWRPLGLLPLLLLLHLILLAVSWLLLLYPLRPLSLLPLLLLLHRHLLPWLHPHGWLIPHHLLLLLHDTLRRLTGRNHLRRLHLLPRRQPRRLHLLMLMLLL